jgi:hypothetical protein
MSSAEHLRGRAPAHLRRARTRRGERGFALLVVVLIAALASVSAVALLDVVDVDLLVAGEHSKNVAVSAVAAEAVREVIADVNSMEILPDFQTPDLTRRYVARDDSGNYVKGPDNAAPIMLSDDNSAVVREVGRAAEEAYVADAVLLGLGPAENSGFTTTQAVYYEISVTGLTGNGARTKEHRVGLSRLISVPPGTQLAPVHAR